jgi:hypothetical protein
MASLGRSFLVFFLLVLAAPPSYAVPSTCEAMQGRIKTLRTAVEKATDKKEIAKRQVELDQLVKHSAERCPKQQAGKPGVASSTDRRLPVHRTPPAETPEEEINNRREEINLKRCQFDGKPGALAVGIGGRVVPVPKAIPVDGSILIEGGASSTFYGKVKQEIAYTIRETFVGNLIVTRYYDRIANRYTGQEEYTLQTLSTEIDVERFSGRGCTKYTGSPPTCVQWHQIDLWQIADGEEYPGKFDGVVNAVSDGRSVTIRIDGPDIEFGSSTGPLTINSGCGDTLRETVSRDEFKQWLRRSTVRIRRGMGANRPTVSGCRPGTTLTLELHIGPE